VLCGALPAQGGCYNISVIGSGVCREARDGACVGYAEENSVDGGRHGTPVGVIAAGQCTDEANQQKCEASSCNVLIGENTYCSKCSTTSEAPVNGVCTATTDTACEGSVTTGLCTQCKSSYFLHKGGCYQIEGTPGSAICKTAGAAGICQVCQAGYFKNPVENIDATHQSCIACSETTAVDRYQGVANCAECTAPTTSGSGGTAKCTKCTDPNYLMTATDGSTSCVTECPTGYFGHTATSGGLKTCQSCSGTNDNLDPAAAGVAGCAACTYSDKVTCTKCEAGKYLKTTSDSTSCVEASGCGSGFFPKADDKAGNKYMPCGEAGSGGIADCAECSLLPSASRAGAILITCTKCSKNNLSPLKDACLDTCPAGTYDDNSICTPCHTSCSECADDAESSCTACYPGHVLNKTDSSTAGTCIPECTGRYAENCEKDMCTAVLGGSKYCSKCKSGYVPVDGVCVSAGTRAAPTGCTPKGDGTCSACTEKYFLESGGCYQAAVYPGNTLCTTAASGKCTSCANGQTADSGTGSCPACDSTCKTCSAKNNPAKCQTCYPGSYLDSTRGTCVECSKSSSSILGVENCISCAPPANNQGSVTCYVKTSSGGGNSTDDGANLSTGAIAGISVAAVVVVGGLVGFLCWWFVCRGKA
ncbi:Variant-specific surface protein, partial [Giardia duodenalis]